MDGLEKFEKALAEEKAAMERQENREKSSKHGERHRHRHHHRSRRHRDEDEDREGHRHKRPRETKNIEVEENVRHKPALLDEEADTPYQPTQSSPLKRDAWMTAPHALDIDYTQKGTRKVEEKNSQSRESALKIHKNELNSRLQEVADSKGLEKAEPTQHDVDYTFGDSGSQWRMTKLKAVYTQAKQSGRSVDEVAMERFGDLRGFDDAREEQIDLERRGLYGKGYIGKEKPSGDLFQERKMSMGTRSSKYTESHELSRGQTMEAIQVPEPVLDQTTLNKLRAQMMKAKLKGAQDAAQLEEEYNKAATSLINKGPEIITLGAMDSRMLLGTRGEAKSVNNRRGRERGLVEENEDMTVEDMVREERRTRGQAGGEGQRFAERIAKDAKFDNDLDYMDENAQKLARRVQKSEINLKNIAINDYQKISRILDNCPLCHHEDKNLPPIAPLISLATRVYLTLPTEPELSEGGAVIVPIQHRVNLLECDDDEWEEIRNFMKSLTRLYHDQGRDVLFYENAAAPHRKMHAAMQAVPIPYSLGETAPAFFREAILASDEEWSQHKKLIDTAARARDGLGKLAFRRSIAKEMPYFHVWFNLDGGLGHIVEDSSRWGKGDLFAREVIGGMLDVGIDVIKRQGRWNRGSDKRVEDFKKRWKKFDWTRVLTDG
jgi:hypothetical protein